MHLNPAVFLDDISVVTALFFAWGLWHVLQEKAKNQMIEGSIPFQQSLNNMCSGLMLHFIYKANCLAPGFPAAKVATELNYPGSKTTFM